MRLRLSGCGMCIAHAVCGPSSCFRSVLVARGFGRAFLFPLLLVDFTSPAVLLEGLLQTLPLPNGARRGFGLVLDSVHPAASYAFGATRGPQGGGPPETPRARGGSRATPVETTKVAVAHLWFFVEHGPLPLVISSQRRVLVAGVGRSQARTNDATFSSLSGSRRHVRRGACQLGASGRE